MLSSPVFQDAQKKQLCHYETDGRRVGLKTQTPYLAFDTHGVFRQPQIPISSSQARNAQGIWSEGHTPSYSGPQHYHSMGFDWTPFGWNTSQYDSAPCCPLKRGSRFAGLESQPEGVTHLPNFQQNLAVAVGYTVILQPACHGDTQARRTSSWIQKISQKGWVTGLQVLRQLGENGSECGFTMIYNDL